MLANLDIYLPIVLLILSALTRLLIDRQVGKQELLETLCDVPMDLIFLAMSFVLALIVAKPNPEKQAVGLFMILVFVVLSLIIALLRRRTIKDALSQGFSWYGRLTLNFILSLTALFLSIALLKDNSNSQQSELNMHKTEQIKKGKQNA